MCADLVNGLGGRLGFGENSFLQAARDGSDNYTASNGLDDSSVYVDLRDSFSDGINVFGNQYDGVWINANGNLTFEGPNSDYTPDGIAGLTEPTIAPYFADVDIRNRSDTPVPGDGGDGTSRLSNDIYWGVTQEEGKSVLTVTWDDVGSYPRDNTPTNAFQVRITDQGNGDFDVEFRYEDVNWLLGRASDGQMPTVGITDGEDNDFEIGGSGTRSMADLEDRSFEGGEPGVIGFSVRNGAPSICFAAGTLIDTPTGPRAVETLRPGDLVRTMDHGAQPVRWAGSRWVSRAEMALDPRRRPVLIRAGAFGHGAPARDLTVSRQHRVLVGGPAAQALFGAAQALAPAIGLIDGACVTTGDGRRGVMLIHLLFDRHEVVFSEGLASESLHPGPQALAALTPEAQAELRALRPDLADPEAPPPAPARRLLTRREAARWREADAMNRRLSGVSGVGGGSGDKAGSGALRL